LTTVSTVVITGKLILVQKRRVDLTIVSEVSTDRQTDRQTDRHLTVGA